MLGDVLARERVTVLWLRPLSTRWSTRRQRAVAGPATARGGQALSVPHVRRALDALPAVRLINGYGPTESTTFACCHRDPARPARRRRVGADRAADREHAGATCSTRPHAARAGRRSRRAATSGATVSRRGYLDRPALTAERFVPIRSRTAGRAAVPHRRPGALAAGRHDRVRRAGWTTRSRSAASASSPARSRRCCAGTTTACATRPWSSAGHDRRQAAGRVLVPAGCAGGSVSDDVRAFLRERCRTTWSVGVVRLDALPLTPTARSIAAACRADGRGGPAS